MMVDSLEIHRGASPRYSPEGKGLVYTEAEWDRKNDRQVPHLWIPWTLAILRLSNQRTAKKAKRRRSGRPTALIAFVTRDTPKDEGREAAETV